MIALPIVMIVGVVVGTVLSGDDEAPEEERTTLEEGTAEGTEWRVDAVRDVEGDTCAFLYTVEEPPLTGGCTAEPQDATFGSTTVVFGMAEPDAEAVQVELSDGEVVEIDTITADGVDGRFYVTVVEGDVDAERLAP